MSKPQVISATTLRNKTRDILEQAKFKGEQFVVETFGKPMAVVVGVDEYWELVDQAHRREHPGSEEDTPAGQNSRQPDAAVR
jgi:prevent-host-death family protein